MGSLDVNFLLFIFNDVNHLVESNPDNVIKKGLHVYLRLSILYPAESKHM